MERRSIRSRPSFSPTAPAGATASFGAAHAVLRRSLAFADPDWIVRVFNVVRERRGTVSRPDFSDWRAQSLHFTGPAAINEGAYALTGDGPAEQTPSAEVIVVTSRISGPAAPPPPLITHSKFTTFTMETPFAEELLDNGNRAGRSPALTTQLLAFHNADRAAGRARCLTGTIPLGTDLQPPPTNRGRLSIRRGRQRGSGRYRSLGALVRGSAWARVGP